MYRCFLSFVQSASCFSHRFGMRLSHNHASDLSLFLSLYGYVQSLLILRQCSWPTPPPFSLSGKSANLYQDARCLGSTGLTLSNHNFHATSDFLDGADKICLCSSPEIFAPTFWVGKFSSIRHCLGVLRVNASRIAVSQKRVSPGRVGVMSASGLSILSCS